MTPVILLTDGYLANGAEPWRIPDVESLPPMEARHAPANMPGFHPFLRDSDTLARPWAVPGTPGLMHRIGGIEKSYDSGHISYDPHNHQRMCETRAAKIAGIARDLPPVAIEPDDRETRLLVLGWGSTYGAIREAVARCRARGLSVSHAHLRSLNPLPENLGEVLARFDRVLVPEMNLGQLVQVIRARYLVPAESYPKIEGLPFSIDVLETRISNLLRAES
jgi:2-oxoglutarate ferredoxin oxidoreductase subunit alpha